MMIYTDTYLRRVYNTKTQSLEKVYKEYLKMPCEDTKNKWYKVIREEIEEGDISE